MTDHNRAGDHMRETTEPVPVDGRTPAPPDQPAGPSSEPATATDPKQTVMGQLGGTSGMVYTTVPVVAFAAVNSFVGLPVAIGVAIAVALVITVLRRVRGEPLMTALGGVFGVAAAGGIAAWTGSAGGFFLLGIWAALAGAVVLLVSVFARRPLTGVVWNAIHGGKHAWREDRPSLYAHDVATLAVTAVFGSRYVVQQWLYDAEATGWLAFADVVMGVPLLALGLLVAVWAFRRSTKRLIAPQEHRSAEQT